MKTTVTGMASASRKLALAAWALTACWGGNVLAQSADARWNQIVEAAKKEGRVVFYTTTPQPPAEALGKAFMAKYPGIKFEFVRGTSGEIEPRVEAERNSGAKGADVITNTNHGWVIRSHQRGDFVKLVGPQARSDVWRRSKWLVDETWITGGYFPFVIAWNTDLVKNPVRDLDDMARRTGELKGAICMVDPKLSPTIVTMVATSEQRLGPQWLKNLGAVKPVPAASTAPCVASVGSGEMKAGFGLMVSLVEGIKAKGAPVAWAVPPKGTGAGIVLATATPKWAANPNAAQLFIDFMMSPDGQKALAATGGLISPIPGIPGSIGGPDEISPMPLELNTPDFTTKYLQQLQALFAK